MAFHISGFLQQMVSGTKSSESASTESAAAENAGQTEQTAQVNTINAKYLAPLLAGDTVTGVCKQHEGQSGYSQPAKR